VLSLSPSSHSRLSACADGRFTVYQLPPNPQGLAALQALNLLEGFDLPAMGFNSADHLHASVEAKKLAFADAAT